MSTMRNGLTVFGFCAILPTLAAASPMQVNLQGYIGSQPFGTNVRLTDDTQPLSLVIESTQLLASSGPNGYYGGGPIISSFYLDVSVSHPDSPSPPGWDSVVISGTIQGSYSVTSPLLPNISGTVAGVDIVATLSSRSGGAGSYLPPYLADLLAHPGRIGITGSVNGGSLNLLQATLTIAPPVDPIPEFPAPEPSMRAIVLMALASLPLARRWQKRRR